MIIRKMNNRLFTTPLCCIGLVLLSGCNVVYTERPMGEQVVVLDEATWQGTWIGEEVVILTTVLDSEQGRLEAAWVERGPQGAKFESMTGTVRRSGSSMYLNMKQPDSDTPLGWVWARIELDGRKALVWPPDVEQFTTAVNEQVLPGTVQESGDVVLGSLSEEHQARIETPASPLLHWSSPLVFIRIGN